MSQAYSLTTITQTPLIEEPKLREILKDIYGIVSCDIFKLSGYDDLNFRLEHTVFGPEANTALVSRNETTFIVKFTNPLESVHPQLLDGQIKLAEHLKRHGIPCAETLPAIDGSLWKTVKMTAEVSAPIRLYQFLEGVMLEKVGYNNTVFRLVGTLLADFHNATGSFSHPAYVNRYHFMCMENWDALEEEFRYQVDHGLLSDQSHIALCQKGFDDLRKDILTKKASFKAGIIHSDFNETNVLLRKLGDSQYEITGLLDFGDTHDSLLIYDIAALVLYLAVDAKEDNWRTVAKAVVAGYAEKREPADLERILVSMRARLVSSLVYGRRTVRINYRNEDSSYILKMQANGWRVLELLTKEYDENNRLIGSVV